MHFVLFKIEHKNTIKLVLLGENFGSLTNNTINLAFK